MPAELARRFERRSRTYEARALPTELHQRKTLEAAGRIALPYDLLCRQTTCCLGYTASTLERSTGNCTRTSGLHPSARKPRAPGTPDLAIRGTAPIRTPPSYKKWSEQRELNSRHRVGGPRHQPLYHARSSKNSGRGDRIRTCLNWFWGPAPFPSGPHPSTPASQSRSPGTLACGGRNGS